jgi:hypothetical protein
MSSSGARDGGGPGAALRTTVRHVDPRASALTGAASYVLAYSLMVVVASADPGVKESVDGVGWSNVEVVGWLFYGAHFVPMEEIREARDAATPPRQSVLDSIYLSDPELLLSGNFLYSTGELVVPAVVYVAVPALTLACAGYLLTISRSAPSVPAGVARGASVVVGYLPVTVAGTYAFSGVVVMGSQQVLVMPDPAIAAVAGTVLPGLLGGAGGFVGARSGDSGP